MTATVVQALVYLLVAAGGYALRHAQGGKAAPSPAAPAGPADLGAVMKEKLKAELETLAHDALDGLLKRVVAPAAK